MKNTEARDEIRDLAQRRDTRQGETNILTFCRMLECLKRYALLKFSSLPRSERKAFYYWGIPEWFWEKIKNGVRFAREKKWWILGVMVWAVVSWVAVKPLPSCQCLRVIMFDIGQGDAFVLEMPDQRKFLVDFGRGSLIVPAYQRYFGSGERKISQAIFTHPDLDHLGGSLALLRQYVFEKVLGSWPKHEIVEVVALQNYLKQISEQAVGPKKIQLASEISMEIFWPRQDIRNQPTKNTNDQSMVFKLIYKNASILMTGDAEEKTEKELLKQKTNLQADILKVSHHGSKTGTSLEFLKAVSPQTALISVGADNKYGHPHLEVIKRLASQNVKTYRTDQIGDVILRSDGQTWSVETKPLWQAWQEWLLR